MLAGLSSALSGMTAASRRVEASASNIANINSYGSIPSGDAAVKRDPYVPVRVEQTSNAEGGTTTSLRSLTPSYIPVFDNSSAFADSDGFVAAPNVDIADQMIEMLTAKSEFMVNVKTVETISEMVRKLYDLPA